MRQDTTIAAAVSAPPRLAEWLKRWDGGEKIRDLATEAGVSWQKLHGLLTRQRSNQSESRPVTYKH